MFTAVIGSRHNPNQQSTLYGCADMVPQRFWGHDVDRLCSRDVMGHATIRGPLKPPFYLA